MMNNKIEKHNHEVLHYDLLFFASPRSVFCRRIEKRLHEILKETRVPIKLIKIDVTKAPELIDKYNIVVCPTLIFRDFEIFGNIKLEDLEELIKPYFP